jgi:predicted GNAT family acetyltransferase
LNNGRVRVVLTRDVAEFAERSRDFLTRRPIEHNVIATVVGQIARGGYSEVPLFAWVEADEGGEVLGAGLRTPPRSLLASTMSAEVAAALMPRLIELDPELPGVNGPEPAVSHLAEGWRRCTGGAIEPHMDQAIYWLAQVDDPPRRPRGRARAADESDRGLMTDWAHDFNREVGVPTLDVAAEIEIRIADRRLFVWEDGRVASMVGIGPPVAGVVRLGPVYTPPKVRRRGYATALVADVSRGALAAGAMKCMLYTDLANATSNSIYQAVGYQCSHAAREYLFSPNHLAK